MDRKTGDPIRQDCGHPGALHVSRSEAVPGDRIRPANAVSEAAEFLGRHSAT